MYHNHHIKIIILVCVGLGIYACSSKSSANNSEQYPATIPTPTEQPKPKVATDTIVQDTNARLLSLDTTQDTLAYTKSMLSLAHDREGDKWPGFYIVPEMGAILPFHRVVAMYGNFYSTHMGILGRLPQDKLLALLDDELKAWQQADSLTQVIPAIHYIAITAQSQPGKGGTYRLRMPTSQIQKAIDLARKVNGLTFLDVQIGHSSVRKEVPTLEEYLLHPDVHLGLDPEWSMQKGVAPGKKIGTMDAVDINFAIDYLSHLVKEHHLPPKILVVHRFTKGMITHQDKIKCTPQVQLVINMDGFGFPAKKKDSYNRFVGGLPIQFTGFKLFYKNDKLSSPYRLMTPAEILRLYPKPIYIQYQ